MSSVITPIFGYTLGNVDGVASVAATKEKLDKNPTDPKLQAAYNAAYWNAQASLTSWIPGTGGVMAAKAYFADVADANANGWDQSKVIAATGNLVAMLAHGILLAGASEVVLGGIVVAEAVDAIGIALTVGGAVADSADITSWVQQKINSLGLQQNADGSYQPALPVSGTATINSDNSVSINYTQPQTLPAGSFNVPQLDANGNVVGYSVQVPTGSQQIDGGITVYTFAGGETLQHTDSGTTSTATAFLPDMWTYSTSNGTVTLSVSLLDGYMLYTDPTGSTKPSMDVSSVDINSNGSVSQTSIGGTAASPVKVVEEISSAGGLSTTPPPTVTVSGGDGFVDISNANITFTSGSGGTITGTNNSVYGSDGQITFESDATATVVGTGLTLNLGTNANVTITSDPNAPTGAAENYQKVAANDTIFTGAIAHCRVAA